MLAEDIPSALTKQNQALLAFSGISQKALCLHCVYKPVAALPVALAARKTDALQMDFEALPRGRKRDGLPMTP